MKPEETDQSIRQLLEEIDSMPSLEWNETRVWNKISFKLRFFWLLKLLPIIGILSIITVYILWPKEETQPIASAKKLPESIAIIQKTDSVKIFIPTKPVKRKYKKEIHSTEKAKTNLQTKQFKLWRPRPIYHQTFQPIQGIKMSTLTIPDSISQQINLRMPQLHIVNMDVNNSFNTKNLFRSLENKDNTYYRYRYNSRYIPDPFNNMNQQSPSYQPQIIQYP